MNSSTLCHGVTLKGKPCTKRTLDSSQFCHHHKIQAASKIESISETNSKSEVDSTQKDECCVCYEMMPISESLGCKHLVCKGCLGKMRDDRCPMCRTPMKMTTKAKQEIQRRRVQDTLERHQIHLTISTVSNMDLNGPEGNIFMQPYFVTFGNGPVFGLGPFGVGQPLINNPYTI